ncbi:hypothetical protein P4544_09735 [Halomonas sp. LY9]
MKCPHCGDEISLFSREMNRLGKDKICKNCHEPIRVFVSFKMVALLFIPAIVLAILLKPVFVGFGLSGSLAIGLTTGVAIMLSMRLKAA